MLIPTEHNADEWMEVMETLAIFNPGDLPGYGPRAWCRLEWFIFTLWAAIQGEQRVQLCAVNVEGELIDYPEVIWEMKTNCPSAVRCQWRQTGAHSQRSSIQ